MTGDSATINKKISSQRMTGKNQTYEEDSEADHVADTHFQPAPSLQQIQISWCAERQRSYESRASATGYGVQEEEVTHGNELPEGTERKRIVYGVKQKSRTGRRRAGPWGNLHRNDISITVLRKVLF